MARHIVAGGCPSDPAGVEDVEARRYRLGIVERHRRYVDLGGLEVHMDGERRPQRMQKVRSPKSVLRIVPIASAPASIT